VHAGPGPLLHGAREGPATDLAAGLPHSHPHPPSSPTSTLRWPASSPSRIPSRPPFPIHLPTLRGQGQGRASQGGAGGGSAGGREWDGNWSGVGGPCPLWCSRGQRRAPCAWEGVRPPHVSGCQCPASQVRISPLQPLALCAFVHSGFLLARPCLLGQGPVLPASGPSSFTLSSLLWAF